MAQDCYAASSHLHIASCYEGSEDSSAVESMTRPLITMTRSSDATLETEEHTRLEERCKQQGKSQVRLAFLLGSASGYTFVMGFAFYGALSLVSSWILVPFGQVYAAIFVGICWMLVLLSQACAVIFFGICLTFLCASRVKSGSLCGTRKKVWDQDVDTSAGSNSILMSHTPFFVGICSFVCGFEVGASLIWTIVHLREGVDVRFLIQMLINIVINLGLFWIVINDIDSEHDKSGGEQEEEEEEQDDFFSLSLNE